MKVYCVVTPSHQPLYERFFLSSLDRKSFELYAYTLDQKGAGEFLAEDFKRCIQFKLAKIIESIQRNHNAVIVWSDVDIQFFGLQPRHILAYFDPGTDFVVQRWSLADEDACGGFYSIRCSPKMEDFFSEITALTADTTDGNEQVAINLALKSASVQINWRLFGREFYSRSHGIQVPSNALMHHATCLASGDAVKQKMSLLAGLQEFQRWNYLTKQYYILRQLPAALRRRLASLQ
jgi:hypothetical protein